MSNNGHFDEGHEVFCIVALIVLWCLSLVSLIFLLPAVAIVLYVVYEPYRANKNTDEEPKASSDEQAKPTVPKRFRFRR